MCYSVLVEQDLKNISQNLGAAVAEKSFEYYKHLTILDPKRFKPMRDNQRIYPGYFLPVVVNYNGEKVIFPMRYRIRPFGSEKEVPTRYNMFNARLDSLDKRETWQRLFRKKHGIIPLKAFYEWVIDANTGKKNVVKFSPKGHEIMYVPVLWDEYHAREEETGNFRSCAIITTEPTEEVMAAGHDRCPIFLPSTNFEQWLNPNALNESEVFSILKQKENVYYDCEPAST